MLVGVTQPTILRSVRVLTGLPSDRALLADPFHGFAFVAIYVAMDFVRFVRCTLHGG